MELFSSTTKFDFVGKSRGFIIFSALSILASFGLIFGKGLNFGIEFAGGTEALVSFTGPTSLDDVRAVCDGIGLDQAELVRYGITDEGRYFVRSRTRSLLSPAEVDKVRASIVAKHGEPSMWDASDETGEEIRVRFEGAKTADELKTAALESGITGIEVSAQTASSPASGSSPWVRRSASRCGTKAFWRSSTPSWASCSTSPSVSICASAQAPSWPCSTTSW